MRNKVSLFRTMDTRLNIGLLLSLICIILINFVFNKTEELFSGGAKLGEILTDLSLAFIASYIFYFVVVHIKYIKDKEHLDPYIELKSRRIITTILELTFVDEKNKYPSETELNGINRSINLLAPYHIPIIPNINTVADYIYHCKKISEEHVKDLLVLSHYLESEHIKLLLHIQEISDSLDTFKYIKLNNSISDLSSSFYPLLQSAKNLEEYCNIKFSNTFRFYVS